MAQNYVRIIRYPLITNQFSPLKHALADDMSLMDAIQQSVAFGDRHNQSPSYLFHNGKTYDFMHNGVIERGGENNKILIKKIQNPYYDGFQRNHP